MKLATQNLQPLQLSVVSVTKHFQYVPTRLGNEATPFYLNRDLVPVLIKTGDYGARYQRSTRYVEAVMPMTKSDLDTLHRMVSAVDLGYSLLLSLPMLDLSFLVTAETLTEMLTVGDDTYYTMSFYDTPPYISWFKRLRLNRRLKKAGTLAAVSGETK